MDTELDCSRLFWFIYNPYCGKREPQRPSAEFGDKTHKELEKITTTGETSGWEAPRINAVARELARLEAEDAPLLWPAERQIEVSRKPELVASIFKHPAVLVEHPFKIVLPDAPDGGPRSVKGKIDIVDGRKPLRPKITDYKTTSDPKRWAKTEYELMQNAQLTIYAKWALDTSPEAQAVDVRHIVIQSKGPARVYSTTVEMDRAGVEQRFENYKKVFERMDRLRVVPDAADVPATGHETGRCHKYGGCYFRNECAAAPFNKALRAPQGNETMSDDLFNKLQAMRAGPDGPPMGMPQAQSMPQAPAPFAFQQPQAQQMAPVIQLQQPSPAQSAPAGFAFPTLPGLPQMPAIPAPMAPPPQTVVTQVPNGLAAIKAQKAAEAAAQAASAPPPNQNQILTQTFPPLAAPPVTGAMMALAGLPSAQITQVVQAQGVPPAQQAPGIRIGTLYVNCSPSKGLQVQRFEDWVLPLTRQIHAQTSKVWQEHDYRQGQGRIARGIVNLPEVSALVVDTSHDLGKIALEFLIPMSGIVVEARR